MFLVRHIFLSVCTIVDAFVDPLWAYASHKMYVKCILNWLEFPFLVLPKLALLARDVFYSSVSVAQLGVIIAAALLPAQPPPFPELRVAELQAEPGLLTPNSVMLPWHHAASVLRAQPSSLWFALSPSPLKSVRLSLKCQRVVWGALLWQCCQKAVKPAGLLSVARSGWPRPCGATLHPFFTYTLKKSPKNWLFILELQFSYTVQIDEHCD